MWQLVFQSEPGEKELAAATELVRQHGLESLGRVLLNANEFLLVD
jgi:hypothetical protein